jgi:hypothetical protein
MTLNKIKSQGNLTRKSSGDNQAKKIRKRKKPKPEGQEGLPQHQHCPP